MIHPYLQLFIEVKAVKRFAGKIIDPDSNQTPDSFLHSLDIRAPWPHLDRATWNMPLPTKTEKILYLHSLGCSRREMESALHVGPNTISKVLKQDRHIRQFKSDPVLDLMIEEHWNPIRTKLPKEIFIKNC